MLSRDWSTPSRLRSRICTRLLRQESRLLLSAGRRVAGRATGSESTEIAPCIVMVRPIRAVRHSSPGLRLNRDPRGRYYRPSPLPALALHLSYRRIRDELTPTTQSTAGRSSVLRGETGGRCRSLGFRGGVAGHGGVVVHEVSHAMRSAPLRGGKPRAWHHARLAVLRPHEIAAP